MYISYLLQINYLNSEDDVYVAHYCLPFEHHEGENNWHITLNSSRNLFSKLR